MENYNPLAVENKWQFFFEEKKIFKTNNSSKKKILLFRNVPISIWKHSHGSC